MHAKPENKIQKWADSLALLAAAAWTGGLWGIGYIAVPVLFQTLPDKMLAGMLAGKMFSLIAWVGIACGTCLLLHYLRTSGLAAFGQAAFRVTIIMLLLTIAIRFGIQPVMEDLKAQAFPADIMQSQFADRFKMLHGLSSLIYLAQSLLGAVLVIKARPAK